MTDDIKEADPGAGNAKTMVICICADVFPGVGGIEAIIQDLYAYLSRTKEVHVCVRKTHGPTESYSRLHRLPSVALMLSPFLFPLEVGYWFVWVFTLIRLQRKFHFSVFLAQDAYLCGLAAIVAARLTSTTAVVMDHGLATNIADPRWRSAWRKRHNSTLGRLVTPLFIISCLLQSVVFFLVCRLASRFIYTGHELEHFFDNYHAPQVRRTRYENIVDTELFAPGPGAEAREIFHIPSQDFVINVVSRISFEKGYEFILPALARVVLALEGRVTVLIAGGASQPSQKKHGQDDLLAWIEDFIRSSALERRVLLLGNVPRESIPKIHHASDVHLYAGTMSCSFTVGVLEAMACGLPVIVTPIPEKQRDVVGGHDLGWVIEPESVDAIAEAVLEVARLGSARREIGKRAHEYVVSHHSFGAAGPLIDAAIEQAILASSRTRLS